MIEISTAGLPEKFQDHPEVTRRIKSMSAYFNSERFDRRHRTILCLHEGTHVLYKRMCGFEPKLYGPSVEYDSFAEKFWAFDASTEGMPTDITMNADAMLVAKAHMGPVYVEEKLLNHRTFEQIWAMARGDLRSFNDWSCKRQRLKGDVRGLVSGEKMRESVYRDLRSPAFRKKLWDAAREFEARVFGPEAIAPREAA